MAIVWRQFAIRKPLPRRNLQTVSQSGIEWLYPQKEAGQRINSRAWRMRWIRAGRSGAQLTTSSRHNRGSAFPIVAVNLHVFPHVVYVIGIAANEPIDGGAVIRL
jgi:hypothetical protein